MSVTIPVIETDRLRLRAHRYDDYLSACAMWADPAVTRFIGGRTSTPQQSWSRLLSYLGHWQLQNYGCWAIEEKKSKQFIGEIGFADFKRDTIDDAMKNVPELGFVLIASAHGKGYGTEAVRAVVEWGDAHLPSKRTVCLVDEENAASLRLVEKFGFHPFRRTSYNDAAVVFLERTASP